MTKGELCRLRPLAISCFEDKLVQKVVSEILSRIFEPLFLPCSYGFRPTHSCHEALRALQEMVYKIADGGVAEIDIRKYFNTIPHQPLMAMLQKKISDRRFLKLIEHLIKMPIIKEGNQTVTACGCPQGSIISPILANIYLHYVIDAWFAEIGKTYLRGKTGMVRYADDMVFVFEKYATAEQFYKVLPKRLEKYGLELKIDKSQLLRSGHLAMLKAQAGQQERPGTYKFLGFTAYWGKSRWGTWRLKFKSRADRFTAKLKGMKEYLRKRLTTQNTGETLKQVTLAVKGWINYHAISDNQRRVNSFLIKSRWLIYRWFNRRGRGNTITWDRLGQVLQKIGFPTKFKIVSMFANSRSGEGSTPVGPPVSR